MWAALLPIVSVWGFQFDGVFIGATRTRELLVAMAVAVFFLMRSFSRQLRKIDLPPGGVPINGGQEAQEPATVADASEGETPAP